MFRQLCVIRIIFRIICMGGENWPRRGELVLTGSESESIIGFLWTAKQYSGITSVAEFADRLKNYSLDRP
jgi:hypothetical protein